MNRYFLWCVVLPFMTFWWINNIIELYDGYYVSINGVELIIRIIGIPFLPIGAIMGYAF